MITTRPFSENPITGAKTWWHFDDVTDEIVLETIQDTEPLLEVNYERRKDLTGVMTKMGDGNHLVAELPMHVLYKLQSLGYWEPNDVKGTKLLKWLRDHPRWKTDPRAFA